MARETNYGTRIDYFLLTKGLLPWFKDGDILPSIKGSDHCPVFIDLHDEIVTESGQTQSLKEAMQRNCEPRAPPRLAARYWSEYSGKQKLLSAFFGRKAQLMTAILKQDKHLFQMARQPQDLSGRQLSRNRLILLLRKR